MLDPRNANGGAPLGSAARRTLSATATAALAVLCCGCAGRPARVAMPKFDPQAVADRVMTVCDEDHDGKVAGEELKKYAALVHADSNGDGAVDVGELVARAEFWEREGTAVTPVQCRVRRQGRLVSGAQVEFDPTEFMGDGVEAATGVTGPQGQATVSIPASLLPSATYSGSRCGYFRVAVTPPGQSQPQRTDVIEIAGDLINEVTVSVR